MAFARDSRENSFIARLWATQRVGFLSAEKRNNGGSREIDDEIRELGERYSIPTEFTSYLVLAPGMEVGDFTGRGMRRDAVAATGSAANAPAPAPVAMKQQVFESARASAEQRAATSLADADGSLSKSADIRRVGSRTFQLRGGKWVDMARRDSTQVVKVRAFSEAYFKLIDAIPELRDVFAIGDKVVVAGKGIAIEIGDDGMSTIDATRLRQVQDGW